MALSYRKTVKRMGMNNTEANALAFESAYLAAIASHWAALRRRPMDNDAQTLTRRAEAVAEFVKARDQNEAAYQACYNDGAEEARTERETRAAYANLRASAAARTRAYDALATLA